MLQEIWNFDLDHRAARACDGRDGFANPGIHGRRKRIVIAAQRVRDQTEPRAL